MEILGILQLDWQQSPIDDNPAVGGAGCIQYDGTNGKLQYSNDCLAYSDFGSGGGGGGTAATIVSAKHSNGDLDTGDGGGGGAKDFYYVWDYSTGTNTPALFDGNTTTNAAAYSDDFCAVELSKNVSLINSLTFYRSDTDDIFTMTSVEADQLEYLFVRRQR